MNTISGKKLRKCFKNANKCVYLTAYKVMYSGYYIKHDSLFEICCNLSAAISRLRKVGCVVENKRTKNGSVYFMPAYAL